MLSRFSHKLHNSCVAAMRRSCDVVSDSDGKNTICEDAGDEGQIVLAASHANAFTATYLEFRALNLTRPVSVELHNDAHTER